MSSQSSLKMPRANGPVGLGHADRPQQCHATQLQSLPKTRPGRHGPRPGSRLISLPSGRRLIPVDRGGTSRHPLIITPSPCKIETRKRLFQSVSTYRPVGNSHPSSSRSSIGNPHSRFDCSDSRRILALAPDSLVINALGLRNTSPTKITSNRPEQPTERAAFVVGLFEPTLPDLPSPAQPSRKLLAPKNSSGPQDSNSLLPQLTVTAESGLLRKQATKQGQGQATRQSRAQAHALLTPLDTS